MNNINREYKDRLFKWLFGRQENRKWTLDLYNAINNSDYTNYEDIRVTTIDDAVFSGMKNDVSFLFLDSINLYEQQSTYNPNMPVRFLAYLSQLYDKYIETIKADKYGSKIIKLPVPKFVVFYNGTRQMAETETIRLSDSFETSPEKSDIDLTVKVYNINADKNHQLMDKCRPLLEYSWITEKYREYRKRISDNVEAFDAVIAEMPEDFLIRDLLLQNKAEVSMMLLKDYTEKELQEIHEYNLKKERHEGIIEGKAEGRLEILKVIINNMTAAGYQMKDIIAATGLTEERIKEITEQD